MVTRKRHTKNTRFVAGYGAAARSAAIKLCEEATGQFRVFFRPRKDQLSRAEKLSTHGQVTIKDNAGGDWVTPTQTATDYYRRHKS